MIVGLLKERTMKISLTQNELAMMVINGTFIFVMSLASVFVNVVLYVISGSLVTMTLYTIIRFGLFPFAFMLGAKLSNKYKIVYALILGLSLLTLGYLGVLFAEGLIRSVWFMFYILAFVFGLGEGLFWFSMNALNQLISSEATRNTYLSVMGMVNAFAQIVAPLLATLILSLTTSDQMGYTFIFQLVIVFMFIIIYFGLKVDSPPLPTEFKVREISLFTKHKDLNLVHLTHFMFGLRDSLVLVITGLLIYNATGGSGSVYSRLLALFALINIIAFEVVRRFNTHQTMIKFFIFGGAIMSFSLLLIVYIPTLSGAVIYGLLASFAGPFYVVPLQQIAMRAIGDHMGTKNMFSLVIAREISLTSGRVLGMVFVVLLSLVFPENFIMIAVTVLSIFPLGLTLVASSVLRQKSVTAI